MASRITLWILVIFTIIVGIVAAVFIYLYVSKENVCPAPVAQYKPDADVLTLASDCVDSATCTYTMATLKEAQTKCTALGAKCPAFSWNPDTDEMKVGETTASTDVVGTDFYLG